MMIKRFATAVALIAGLSAAALSRADVAPPSEGQSQRDPRMGWCREARFGMFIHWNISSVPAGQYKGKAVKAYGEWILRNTKIPIAEYADYFVGLSTDAGAVSLKIAYPTLGSSFQPAGGTDNKAFSVTLGTVTLTAGATDAKLFATPATTGGNVRGHSIRLTPVGQAVDELK